MKLADSPPYSWLAELDLDFELRGQRTVMCRNRHEGPLIVQKALYPEGPRICQVVIIHPPGGIAGGDELRVNCDLGYGAHVQMTTPGATKWYESFDLPSKQVIKMNLKANSVCEWLPQENIIFNKCSVDIVADINIESGGVFIGWDFYSLGRHVEQAPMLEGRLKQKTNIVVDGVPVFTERTLFNADQFIDGPGILDGFSSYGTMFIVGLPRDDLLLGELRQIAEAEMHCALTWLDDLLIARWVGQDIERGRQVFTHIWSRLRPTYSSNAAIKPRIWNT